MALAGVGMLAVMLGWLTPAQPWEISTGWQRIPADELPRGRLPDGLGLTWLGHSGFVVRWRGVVLLLDPNLSERCTVSPRRMPVSADAADLRGVDGVLISHAHYDHLHVDTLARVPSIGFTAIPTGCERYIGVNRAERLHLRPVSAGDAFRAGPLEIVAVPAAHNGSRFHPFGSRVAAVGYVIRDGRHTLYFAGDTAAHNDFAGIRDRYRPDIAILPIGAFAPRHALKIHHLNPEDAVAAAETLGVKTVVPCHFGTFRLSLDRPDVALPRFASAAGKRGIEWVMPELEGYPAT